MIHTGYRPSKMGSFATENRMKPLEGELCGPYHGFHARNAVMNQPIITQLFVYPLKSARGVKLERAELAATGFKHDRRFMLVDEAGRFFTQRATPQLALVEPGITAEAIHFSAPGMPQLAVPITQLAESGASRNVTVWRHSGPAFSIGEAARAWFSQYMGQPADLVFMPATPQRFSSIGHRPISFVDGYPFLMIAQASLDALNARLETPLPMDRFRPNIVINGCEPHAEDSWPHVRCGDVDFKAAKPCERCIITCTDQQTLQRTTEPLATLATYRKKGHGTIFGQYFTHRGEGEISVGMPLQVTTELDT